MKTKYVLSTIIISLLLLGVWLSYYIWLQSHLGNITASEKIGHWISLWGLIAAFISASFVIASFWHTNKAYVASKKPALLIRVMKGNPTTEIHYMNTTDNAFEDLTITFIVVLKERTIILKNLSKVAMYMAARDSRVYPFNTKESLKDNEIDLEKELTDNGIILDVRYGFTFLGKPVHINVQKYKLDPTTRLWNII
ncbi:MAG: hypothetical protein HYY50_05195 [Candidatus Kerfeldbacteria bacterium]|nr:hypothetical protein [Candidatus Kerfeldbacteria bacterium]